MVVKTAATILDFILDLMVILLFLCEDGVRLDAGARIVLSLADQSGKARVCIVHSSRASRLRYQLVGHGAFSYVDGH
jgi:hypothetical protein